MVFLYFDKIFSISFLHKLVFCLLCLNLSAIRIFRVLPELYTLVILSLEVSALDFELEIILLEKEFEFCLNRCLQMFRPDLFNKFWVKADWDQFDQSQEEKQAQVEDIRHGIRTINEVRVERGYQKVDDENADKLLIRSDLGLLEDIVFNSVMPSNDWGTTEEDNSNSNSNEEWKQNDEKDNEGVWKNGEDNGEWRNS